ncbi:MAG: hypothetical protein H6Q90_958, partial [Deltaproteobacteria bacterium]|nr:hypothetical protein [Deltaproteobacteria bacterium]
MRLALAAAFVLSPLLSSVAVANPPIGGNPAGVPVGGRSPGAITAGVSLGLSQAKADAQADASQTLGLFGRLGLSSRLSGQLELSRYQTDDGSSVDIRTATALLVVDLARRGHWMPTLVAGIGIDDESSGFSSTSGHHIEGGFGLEYRVDGGLTIGADLRMGGRSLDNV